MCTLTYNSVCEDKLGMANRAIPDSAITASSQDGWATAAHGRLNGNRFWSPTGSDAAANPWLQADIGYLTYVSGVMTQGDGASGIPNWITSLKVSTSEGATGDTLVFIQDTIDTDMVKVSILKIPCYIWHLLISIRSITRNTTNFVK